MRLNLNLSRRPFTNHRLFWIGVAIVFFISLWFGLWVTAEKTIVSAKANEMALRIEAQQQNVSQLKEEQEKQKQSQQKTVLGEADLLQLAAARQLIATKAFSWNRMITDFEKFVPKDTRILSIKVEDVYNAGHSAVASVEVKAIGKTPAQMTEMLTSFEKSSGLFSVGQMSQDAATESGEVPFTINVTYDPSRGGAQ